MNAPEKNTPPQPLAGLRVVEFTHMVMGPTCGMVLALKFSLTMSAVATSLRTTSRPLALCRSMARLFLLRLKSG